MTLQYISTHWIGLLAGMFRRTHRTRVTDRDIIKRVKFIRRQIRSCQTVDQYETCWGLVDDLLSTESSARMRIAAAMLIVEMEELGKTVK